MGIENIMPSAVGLGATAFGGPIAGGIASSLFSGLLGGGSPTIVAFGGGAGAAAANPLAGLLSGGGTHPEIANEALSLFQGASTPEQKDKLLDVAILALGGGASQAQAAAPASLPQPAALATPPAPPAPADAPASTATPPASSDGSGMTVKDNTVDTGRYTITANPNDGGTVKIFDKQTNSFVQAAGDPHVTTSRGDKADFQKNGLSIKLPDGTSVSMKPTTVDGNGKSYVSSVMVEKGGEAVTMSGLHDGKISTSQVQPATKELEAQNMTQGQTVLDASDKDVGDLWMTGANGQRTTELNSKDHETHLDGMGGSLGDTAPKGTQLAYNPAMLEKLGQVLYLTGENVTDPTMQQSLVSNVQSALHTYTTPIAA